MPVRLRSDQNWSQDFLSNTFAACQKFRIPAVNDDCGHERLAMIADTSCSGARVARELDALVRTCGKPACVVSDNGTEFTRLAILKRRRRRMALNRPLSATTERLHRVVQRQPDRNPPPRGTAALQFQLCQASLVAGLHDTNEAAPCARAIQGHRTRHGFPTQNPPLKLQAFSLCTRDDRGRSVISM
jgi:hypothetical protein